MKQYVIDQLRESDHEEILNFLNKHTEKTALEGLYWVDLPKDLYTAIQSEHKDCQSFYFAVNLTLNSISFEFLIRSRQIIRCNCISYATPRQRDYIMQFADGMLDRLNLRL